LLIPPSSGSVINTTTPLIIYNRDPVFVANNLLTTVYVWATDWSGATVQIQIAPQVRNSQYAPVWFSVGSALSANGFFTFQHRWGQMQAVVTNATGDTDNLTAVLFEGVN